MERNIIKYKMINRISDSKIGELFLISDFLDIANYDAVRKVLSRLSKDKKIIRVMRGIYKKPHFNNFLQMEIPVSPDYLAKTIARNHNWTIGPRGDAALNILGLSTQVPAVYHYISDGPSKKINYGDLIIVFSKRSNKEVSGYSYKTILIIEAIRTLGQHRMNDEVRNIIVKKCTVDDFKLLNKDGKNSRRWIYEEIKKILELGGYDYVRVG